MNKKDTIGIFDSGIGGVSIWEEIHQLLPNESTIYLADSKNAPYGNKSQDEIISLSIKNIEKLIELGAKIIVVACNTATTNAIETLRSKFSLPIIGVEPAIKPAILQTKTNNIGVLATRGTLSSTLFSETTSQFSNEVEITEVIGEGLVTLIEEGSLNSLKLKTLLKKYLEPMLSKNIDYLVLGCSHYPYLIPLLKELLPQNIKIIHSGEAVAKQTKYVLEKNHLLSEKKENTFLFYSNFQIETLKNILADYRNKVIISKLDF